MQRTQYPFEVHHPDIDETLLENEPIEQAVERLARQSPCRKGRLPQRTDYRL